MVFSLCPKEREGGSNEGRSDQGGPYLPPFGLLDYAGSFLPEKHCGAPWGPQGSPDRCTKSTWLWAASVLSLAIGLSSPHLIPESSSFCWPHAQVRECNCFRVQLGFHSSLVCHCRPAAGWWQTWDWTPAESVWLRAPAKTVCGGGRGRETHDYGPCLGQQPVLWSAGSGNDPFTWTVGCF